VAITTLVAGETKTCPCDVTPDLLGPDDARQSHPSPARASSIDEATVRSLALEDIDRCVHYPDGRSEYADRPKLVHDGGY